jgi:hypothetical protein
LSSVKMEKMHLTLDLRCYLVHLNTNSLALQRRLLVYCQKSLKLLSLFMGALLLPILPCARHAHGGLSGPEEIF